MEVNFENRVYPYNWARALYMALGWAYEVKVAAEGRTWRVDRLRGSTDW